jgi:hypothetical protein
MKQQYARVTFPDKDKKSLHQELTYEIENPDSDEFTVKFDSTFKLPLFTQSFQSSSV